MPTSRTALSLGILIVAAALAACTGPQQPTKTAAQTQESLDSLQAQAQTLLTDPGVSNLSGLLSGFDPNGMPTPGEQLPRGVYVYDPVAFEWNKSLDSDDLELNWEVEGAGDDAKLVFDWNANAETVDVELPGGGGTYEVPQGANVLLTLNGSLVADFDQSATWPVNACGTVTEPGTFYVNGTVDNGGAKLNVTQTGVSFTSTAGGLNAQTQGDLELTADAGTAWLRWDAGLNVSGTRDEDCVFVPDDIESGNVSLDVGVQTGSDDASIGFATNFEFLSPTSPSGSSGIRLTGGRLTVDGALAVTWTGVLDDAGGDGVLGENLTLTFSDGTMSLEDFITEHLSATAFAARVARTLR